MSFLTDLHKSIFDPGFYREAVSRSRGRAVMFMLKLLAFSALVMCVSKTYYLLHSERGVAPLVSAMFGDMAIVDGRLVTEREQPFGVPGDMVAELMNRFVGYPHFFDKMPDNFLIVDTKSPSAAYETAGAAEILLGERGVKFRSVRMEMPYGSFTGGGDFRFTAQAVRELLGKNAVSIAFQFFLTSLFFGSFTMALSVFFLSLAAYIFSVDRARGYRHFARLACYSISPVMLGSALVSMSGVSSAGWMWHVFIILSTIIMFRAMTRAASDRAAEEKEKKEVI